MDSSHLTKGHCVPCEGGVDPMDHEEVAKYLTLLKTPWNVVSDGLFISKQFKFQNFKEAMVFVNKVAEIAEGEGHHPDIKINYNKVDISLTTHAIKGLSTNDFIIASKVEMLNLG